MNKELKELLVSMTVSAAGLPKEPQIYGPLRMIDSAAALATILKNEEPDNRVLSDFAKLVEANKEKCMTDPEGFYDMLQEAVLLLVEM